MNKNIAENFNKSVSSTRDFEKLDLDSAIRLYVFNRDRMLKPINVYVPNTKLFITLKNKFEIIALDLLLMEYSSANFLKPLKILYKTTWGEDRFYNADFMIEDTDLPLQKIVMIEVLNLNVSENKNKSSFEYDSKMKIVNEKINDINKDIGYNKYSLHLWNREVFTEKINLHNREAYSNFFVETYGAI